MKKHTCLMIIYFMILSGEVSAQLAVEAGTNIHTASLNEAMFQYIKAIGSNSAIYIGSENVKPRYPVNSGFAYFESDQSVPGSVMYDNILYKGLAMWYDLVNNEVVVQHPTFGTRVALNNKRIAYFTLEESLFLPVDRKITNANLLRDNFYKVLHADKTTLLARYSKKMSESINDRKYVTNYSKQQSEYFILKGGKYYEVKNVSALLDILGDKRQALQEKIRLSQKQLRDSKEKETTEQAMIRIISDYDQISL